MTLVEVLAGTALLGTLLASLLVGSSKLSALSRKASQKEEACRAADELLEGWWPKKEKIPRGQTGEVPGRPGWRWRTSIARQIEVGAAKLDVVAVEVFSTATPASGRIADGNAPVAVRVEILLPAAVGGNGEKNEATNRPYSG